MTISAIDNLGSIATTPTEKTTPQEMMRRTAQQFEAIMLMQLTSAMNAKTDDESGEDNLFGSDGGTDMAKKMFSEQLATSMSQSGGVGLADLIMQQFSASTAKGAASSKNSPLSTAMTAVKDIKGAAPQLKSLRSENKGLPLINRSARYTPPAPETFTGDPNDASVVSSYADENGGTSAYDSYKPLMLDGKVLNSTRPRIVPKYALAENEAAANNEAATTNNTAANTGVSNISPDSSVSNFSAAKVEFQMPVSGRISSGFGTRFHPIDHKTKFHGGIDIAVPQGTPVGAAAAGIVKFAGWKGGYGNAVVLQHADGSETLYGHNEKLLVTEGQQVKAGDTISLSGSTGKSTGPHLHFEVRENGQLVNPQNFLAKVLPNKADR